MLLYQCFIKASYLLIETEIEEIITVKVCEGVDYFKFFLILMRG